jgi:hypothetical protein
MDGNAHVFGDRSPGVEQKESTANFLSYTVGLALAIVATIGCCKLICFGLRESRSD